MRLLLGSIYGVLVLGALSMIYPFLIMLAGTTKSGVDAREFSPWPSFLSEDRALYRKHMEGLFNERIDTMKVIYDSDEPSFELIDPPSKPNRKLVGAWWDFLDEWRTRDRAGGEGAGTIPFAYSYAAGYVDTPISKTVPRRLREYKALLQDEYAGDLDRANRELDSDFVAWHAFLLLPEVALQRRDKPLASGLSRQFRAFKTRLPRGEMYWHSAEGFYKTLFLKMQYTREIAEYNRQHGTDCASYGQVHLARRVPKVTDPRRKALADDWEEFVRESLNLLWIRADQEAEPLYQAFLAAKYGRLAALGKIYRGKFARIASFAEVKLEDVWDAAGRVGEPNDLDDAARDMILSDWQAFLAGWRDPDTGREHKLPVAMIYLDTVDWRFRDYLEATLGPIEKVNEALGTNFARFESIYPPQREAHYLDFLDARGDLRWEFSTRNYRTVLDYLVFHGRGILNTVIYCALSVLMALLVNPLAAYAMSRFRMPTSYKVLLLLMLTMAFPPMVTQIPAFLMLRELSLLNTFAALVLPAMANGYSIFLLKGFFDSLPRELYESAQLDGAGELRMFWQITMALSKPILAVIALNAFVYAYSNFMFALLTCQDERMWTLMVWLYQLNQRSGQGVIYAALIIAAIPTLILFLFCQNIILRGIVVPVEK